MWEFIYKMAMLCFFVWLSTEGIGLAVNWDRRKVAMAMGPVAGVLAYGVGFLPVPIDNLLAWAFAGFMGLVCTMGAKLLNDYGFNPLKKKLGAG